MFYLKMQIYEKKRNWESIIEIMCIFVPSMLKRRLYISLLLLLLPLCATGQNLDYRILKELQERRTEGCDVAMRWVSNSVFLTPAVPLGMAIGGWAADNKDLRVDAAIVGSAWGSSIGLTMGLKYLVRRPRPYQRYEGDLLPVTTEPDPSFPSGHTTMAFATATSLSLLYPPMVYRCYNPRVGLGRGLLQTLPRRPLPLRRAHRSPHWDRRRHSGLRRSETFAPGRPRPAQRCHCDSRQHLVLISPQENISLRLQLTG